jgi:uncharacterized NAD(P)/FAD-binding protein YdhS
MRDVIVIGGGFAGAMTAAHLRARGLDVLVLEPGPLGRGLAYAGPPQLLLNTPSAAMSARPDHPDDFARWLAARDQLVTFAPRAVYGDYLADAIRAVAKSPLEVAPVRALAVTRSSRGFTITCEDGFRRSARALVIALGNAPARAPAVEDPARYLPDPFRTSLPGGDDTVALIGTGLTALDAIQLLHARGHRGRIVAVSRRGLVPLAHGAPITPLTVPRELVRQPSLRALLAWWKSRRVRDINAPSIITALRPVIGTIWARLPLADRTRFLRHVRPRWDVIRHRAPPQVRAVLDRGLADGSVELARGRAVAVTSRGLVLDGGATIEARWVINCSGPERDVRRIAAPLVRSLVAGDLVAPDPLGLGVSSGSDGEASPGVYVVGGWRMADRFESTAVGELRGQALDTANALACHLSRTRTDPLTVEPEFMRTS